MLDEFKKFLLRGNVVELGVGVVMAVAFKSLIDAMVADLMTPLIAAVGGNADFSALTFTLNGSQFRYGDFVNVIISFAITAIVVFYMIVMPMNRLVERFTDEATPVPNTRKCPFCFGEISLRATRCRHCTSEVTAAA